MTDFKSQPTQYVAGIPVRAPNYISSWGGWHLSYNPRSIGYGCDTTALVLEHNAFFILNGDHRKAWSIAADVGGIDGALQYFLDNSGDANKLSEHLYAARVKQDRLGVSKTLRKLASAEMFIKFQDHFKE